MSGTRTIRMTEIEPGIERIKVTTLDGQTIWVPVWRPELPPKPERVRKLRSVSLLGRAGVWVRFANLLRLRFIRRTP